MEDSNMPDPLVKAFAKLRAKQVEAADNNQRLSAHLHIKGGYGVFIHYKPASPLKLSRVEETCDEL